MSEQNEKPVSVSVEADYMKRMDFENHLKFVFNKALRFYQKWEGQYLGEGEWGLIAEWAKFFNTELEAAAYVLAVNYLSKL